MLTSILTIIASLLSRLPTKTQQVRSAYLEWLPGALKRKAEREKPKE